MLVRYATAQGPRIGVVDDEGVLRSADLGDEDWAAVLRELVEGRLPKVGEDPVPDQPTLLPPLTSSSRVFCVAQNYPAHAAEAGGATPPRPIVFLKPPSAFVGPDATAELPRMSTFFDYEGEVAAVIGAEAGGVDAGAALDIVAGYCIGNDGSARDLQPATLADRRQIDWFAAKSSDKGSALGPGVTPRSAVPDFSALHLTTAHNGEVVQDDVAGSMFHALPDLIAFVASIVTLQPGDVLLTGTPAGVGKARGVALADGDTVEITVGPLGTLRTTYAAPRS